MSVLNGSLKINVLKELCLLQSTKIIVVAFYVDSKVLYYQLRGLTKKLDSLLISLHISSP